MFSDNIFYVYRHIRLDTNTPFYVGKGKENRAFSKGSRNNYWKHISVYGYKTEIIFENISEEEAFEKEKLLIRLYKKFGYCEANMCGGGEGNSGWKPSKEWLEECSRRNSGESNPMYGHVSAMKGRKHKPESLLKMSEAQFKRYEAKPPKALSEEHKNKISLGLLNGKVRRGKDHPDWGKSKSQEQKYYTSLTSPKNKKVIDINTNIIYENVGMAAKTHGLNRNTLKNYLSGRRTNKTSLRYFKD